MQVGGDPAGLNGHQIATNTCKEKKNLLSFFMPVSEFYSCFKFTSSRKSSLTGLALDLFLPSHLTTDLVWHETTVAWTSRVRYQGSKCITFTALKVKEV